VTFDDGWADTRAHALPVLRAAAAPAALFVAAGALGRDAPFWQERLIGGWRVGELGDGVLRLLWRATSRMPAPTAFGEPEMRALLAELAALEYDERLALLACYEIGACGGGMLRRDEVSLLANAGMAIGGHGMTREPIPDVADPAAELRASRRDLDPLLAPVAAMSFPHGRYDRQSVVAARRAGWRILFTGDAVLEAAPRGRLGSALLGRIGIPMPVLADKAGRLLEDRLALWLFRRPIRRPGVPMPVL
jgi:peptidoglycan/xylan/chitin deacetylase (PgdA/CDA1 family)